jgi:hypothetical protein
VSIPRKTPADLERARSQIPWVEDDDLDELERRSPGGAAALSLVTWGGGQAYAYDGWRGAGMFTGTLAAIILLANTLPVLIPILVIGMSMASAVDAHRRAKAVTRYVKARTELQLAAGIDPSHYRLLMASAAADPSLVRALPPMPIAAEPAAPPAAAGVHGALIERLRKLQALRRAGVISDHELRERKIDALQQAAPDDRDRLDELLFELLPLVQEGALEAGDVEFLKQLAGAAR